MFNATLVEGPKVLTYRQDKACVKDSNDADKLCYEIY